ncbi:MAG: adenylyl-sulfate kinase [Gammaproteobacteria bacterium]|nr:adenylyl-sulfate kinase [Gammaproteobacteria bacterium]
MVVASGFVTDTREALWHAIIRKNYGCSHFIVGRDHAGPGKDENGEDFYGHYDAQELVKKYQDEIDIEMVPFQEMVYLAKQAKYVPVSEVKDGEKILKISGTELRRRLQKGLDIPSWFSYPEVIAELKRKHPPKRQRGFTLFLTGLSGAGKSTIANAVLAKLMEYETRPVTLLDGDMVRRKLSSELGFSKAHRDLNILRIGYVASEITKNGGIAICAAIAHYEAVRQQVREEISAWGGFIEIYVSTSLALCEQRDRKGLYAKARAGCIKGFTGIDDPYEVPSDPELVIDTANTSVFDEVEKILRTLETLGYRAEIEESCSLLAEENL